MAGEEVVAEIAQRPRHQPEKRAEHPPPRAEAAKDVHHPVGTQPDLAAGGLDHHRVGEVAVHLLGDVAEEDLAAQGGETKSMAGGIVACNEAHRPVADAAIAIVEDPVDGVGSRGKIGGHRRIY